MNHCNASNIVSRGTGQNKKDTHVYIELQCVDQGVHRPFKSKPVWQQQLVCVQKLLQGYPSQLDLLTHENEDLCGGHGSVSAGAKPENKAQAELCNTPFHWSLSSLSATATGGKSHLPGLSMWFYRFRSLSSWACHIVFYQSHCVCNRQWMRAWDGWLRGAALVFLSSAAIIGWLDVWMAGFRPGHLNLNTDPHHSLLQWERCVCVGVGATESKPWDRTMSGPQVGLCDQHTDVCFCTCHSEHLTQIRTQNKEAFLTEVRLHEGTCSFYFRPTTCFAANLQRDTLFSLSSETFLWW